MRNFCSLAALAALAIFAPVAAQAQFSISSYTLVNEVRISRTVSDFEYRATLTNTGAARADVTARVLSAVGTIQVVRESIRFSNVPANGTSVSLDTFILRIDRGFNFNVSSVIWTFSTPAGPIANAGPPQTRPVNSVVTLDGSGSRNPGAGTLIYNWIIKDRPAGSTATIQNGNSVNPTFVIDRAGQYVIELTVITGAGYDKAYVTISTSNSPPVANAGPDRTVAVNTTATLNGSLSTDVDGNPITYLWTLTSRPVNSTAAIVNPTSVTPSLTPDRAGIYQLQLVCNDGTQNSAPAFVTVSTINTAPVANAGSSQMVNVGSTVSLSGAGSTDVDGDSLTYTWSLISIPAQSTATLSSLNNVNTTFVADRPGTYVAQLTVNDGRATGSTTVTISTNAVPAPTANAGPGQSFKWGTTIQLAGSATDPNNRPITYQWSFLQRPSGSTAAFSNATLSNPTFVADRPGTFICQLIASNQFSSSQPVTVTITSTNSTPVANAGPAQSVVAGVSQVVTLDGRGSSDADGDTLTYAWTFTTRPNGSTATLTGPTSSQPTFVPDVAGSYVAQLIVSDPFASSTPVTVTITAAAPGQIQLPSSLSIAPGATVAFPVTLSSPAFATVTINLTLGTPSIATLSANSVVIQQGQTAPASQPTITGVLLGNTSTSGSGTNVITGSGNVSVATTASFPTNTVNIIGTATQNLTLTLAVPAPTGGVVMTLSSNATGVATVPASVTVQAGQTSVTVPVTGVAPGTAVITASGTNVPATTATATVVGVLQVSTASLPNATQGVAYSFNLTTTGGTATAKTWLLTAGTLPTGITLSTAGVLAGTTSTLISNTPLTFQATDPGVPGQVATATLNFSVLSVPPTTMVITSGSPQSAVISTAFAAPLVVTVTGAGGAPASGVTVSFAVPGTGASGTFAGGVNTAVTDASGVATSAAFTANATAGAYNVVASIPSVPAVAAVNFALTNTAGAPASIAINAGNNQSAAISTAFGAPLSVIVKDAGQNVISGVVVNFAVPGSGASASIAGGVTATTLASGIATSGAVSANSTVGPYAVTVTIPSAPGVTGVTFNLTNTAGPAATISATTGGGQSTSVTTAFGTPLTATVVDAGGNPVSGVTVRFLAPGSGASASFATVNTAVTGVNGIATSTVATANVTAGAYNIVVSVPAVPAVASVNVGLTNTAGPAATITATGGTPQSAAINAAFATALSATVRDANNNPVSGVTVQFSVPGNGPSAAFAGGVNTAVTDASGVATTTAVLTANGTAGTYNVVATVPAVPSVTGANFSLTNGAGAPANIVVTSGSGQTATVNTAFTNRLVVTVTDAGGNPVSGATVTFGPPASGATASIAGGNTAVTIANGTATSGILTANTVAGSYNVSASVGALTPVNFGLGNTAGVAASVIITGGTGQSTTVGTAFTNPITATVRDSFNNAVAGATVTFAAPVNVSVARATIANNSGVTGVNGQFTSGTITANLIAGTYNISASVPSLSSVNASFTNLAGPAATITATGGSGQSTSVATPFGIGLTALVRDANNNPVPNAPVLFTAPGSGASGTFAAGGATFTGNTDSTGSVSTSIFTANATAGGPYNVVATSGSATPANFALTNTAAIIPNVFTVSDVTVGRDLQVRLTINLSSMPPAGGIRMSVTSGNQLRALVAPSGFTSGSASLTNILVENTQVVTGVWVQALGANSGTATITVSAAGWTSGTATVTLAPSGVTLTGPGGSSSFSVPEGVNSIPVTVTTGRLSGGVMVEAQAVRPGVGTLSIPLSSSNTAVGTLPGSVGISSTSDPTSSANVNFTALIPGSTTLTVGVPTNFTALTNSGSPVAVTVTAKGVLAEPVTVGRNLAASYQLKLSSPAQGLTRIAISTTDPNLRFATSASNPGTTSLTTTVNSQTVAAIIVPSGGTTSQGFFVYGLASSGSANFTATVESVDGVAGNGGYLPATGTVNFGNSAFLLNGPNGFGGDFNMISSQANQNLDVLSVLLDANGNAVDVQPVQGGLTVPVTVTSSNTAVGVITSSPLNFVGNVNTLTTAFDPVGVGVTTISLSTTTPGFTTPPAGASLNVTVTGPNIGVSAGFPDPALIGKDLQIPASFTLGANSVGVTAVTISVSSGSGLLLSTSATAAGSTSITINVANGGNSGSFFLQSTASSGSASFTVSATGYASRTGSVNFQPSGFLIVGPLGFGASSFTTNPFGRTVQVYPALLASNLASQGQAGVQDLRGGISVPITFNSSAGLGVTFPAVTVTGGSGAGGVSATFTNSSTGATVLTINTPSGFSTPTGAATAGTSVTANINN
ncbi:MAG: hypothetical protein K2X03_00225 [Bryobacteraceae bacterium]|nr:hypothetical protein [Bryobacteraceae bacterium]